MEVEAKFKVDNLSEIEERMGNAEFVIEKVEEDAYFNHPCRDFRETDEALRIRRDIEGIKITYKGKKIDPETKTREEIKIKVDDFDKAFKLFEKLGFTLAGWVKKKRKIYRYGEALICLDHIEDLGSFVEIEIESDDVEKAKEKIFEIAEKLGLSREKIIRASYLEMLRDVADTR
uniref:Class IV adenylate cyclase n=1 Tax=Geoglobus ahangari TaxID=113653 RepID=A0A7C4W2S0_9EURY